MFYNKNNDLDGDPYGIRTRVAAVKGRCPKPLDEGAIVDLIHKLKNKSYQVIISIKLNSTLFLLFHSFETKLPNKCNDLFFSNNDKKADSFILKILQSISPDISATLTRRCCFSLPK